MSSATDEKLLVETLPQVIKTEKQYREIGDRLGDLVGKGRSRDETRLMRLLGLLIEDYDRRHGMPDEEDTPQRSSSSSSSTAERRPRTCFRFSGAQPYQRGVEREEEDQRGPGTGSREAV